MEFYSIFSHVFVFVVVLHFLFIFCFLNNIFAHVDINKKSPLLVYIANLSWLDFFMNTLPRKYKKVHECTCCCVGLDFVCSGTGSWAYAHFVKRSIVKLENKKM